MNTEWNRYDAHIGTNNINDGTTMTTTGGWGCLSQSQELRASERASKDGMAMVFSFFLFYIPLIHLFISHSTCCVGLRVPIFAYRRGGRIGWIG